MGEIAIPDFDALIRKGTGPDGKPNWYNVRDVTHALGYTAASTVLAKLEPDERGQAIFLTPGGPQSMAVVSRPGLLKLCQNSEKHKAKLIARWVNHEVMESVFETGSYAVPGLMAPSAASPIVTALEAALAIAREQEAIRRDVDGLKAEQLQLARQAQDADERARQADAKLREADARMAEAEVRIAEANATAARAQAESLKASQEANRAFRVVSSETDWFCLVTWAETRGVHLPPPRDAVEGKVATAMCRAEGIQPGSLRTTRFPGGVNTYPERILNAWLEGYHRRGEGRNAAQ
jgi:prophage antirepressor-like protein